MADYNISLKTNRVLNVILLGLILILIRTWYLSIVQHDEQLFQSRKPQRRTAIEHVERATIRDRFNVPLALNKMQYNAAVCYAHLRQVPSIVWKKDENGKRVRFQARVAYISELAKTLGKELGMDPLRIEDTIYGKASLFPHTPFIIKEDISEKEYYRLRAMEKDWLGLQTQRGSKRFYPQGKTGADIIGYMGAISEKEYYAIAEEIQVLQEYLSKREEGENPYLPKKFNSPPEVRARLRELQEKAYTINDLVGKAGIESSFDEKLRGHYGKKISEIDIKGNFVRELPGNRKAAGGQRVLLTISSEMQELAEALLSQMESSHGNPQRLRLSSPWIKGGAIVAMIPQTGEVVALASYPRFNPNDFVPTQDPELKKERQSSVLRWLESETHVGEIWDGKRPLERECYSFTTGKFFEENLFLTWENYLDAILSSKSAVKAAIEKINDLKTACRLQQWFNALLHYSEQQNGSALIQSLYEGSASTRLKITQEQKKEIQAKLNEHPETAGLKQSIDAYLSAVSHLDDKLLVIDLCRMAADAGSFSEPLLQATGDQTLSSFRALTQAGTVIQSLLKRQIQELYHDLDFTEWREAHFKDFIQEMRKKEKAEKKYTRPYTEYLDIVEKRMFKEFWQKFRWLFLETFILGDVQNTLSEFPHLQPYLAHLMDLHRELGSGNPQVQMLKNFIAAFPPDLSISYLRTLRSFEELDRPLLGDYRTLRNTKEKQLEKHLAAGFYPLSGYGYGRSQAYRQSTPAGSVFKLVTTYETLLQRYQEREENGLPLDDLNPLTIIDQVKWDTRPGKKGQILGYYLDGTPIARVYKDGRLPRTSRKNAGQIDILGALEQSSNVYFALLATDYMRDPNCLADAARLFGYGEKTGIELPGEIRGNIPNDLASNNTGLFSTAIGQHSLVVTPLQTAQMLCAVANQGKLVKPKIVQLVAGKEPAYQEEALFSGRHYPFREPLGLVGIDFPLFTQTQKSAHESHVLATPTEIKRSIFFPDEIHRLIIEGMRRVVASPKGTAHPSIVRGIPNFPSALKDYSDLKNQLAAKTGTGEILYRQTVDVETPPEMETHIWFAGISFTPPAPADIGKELLGEPELVVIVYLRFGRAGKDGAPLAAQLVKKWREIKAKRNG